jgi:hypothetical protein
MLAFTTSTLEENEETLSRLTLAQSMISSPADYTFAEAISFTSSGLVQIPTLTTTPVKDDKDLIAPTPTFYEAPFSRKVRVLLAPPL